MALYHLLREYSCISFNIVDILRVIGQQLPFVLKKSNESMGRRPFLFGWENILCDGEENARVFSEDMNIKDLLRITKTEMLKLGIETGVLRAKIGNA
jgi:hypothetical protein